MSKPLNPKPPKAKPRSSKPSRRDIPVNPGPVTPKEVREVSAQGGDRWRASGPNDAGSGSGLWSLGVSGKPIGMPLETRSMNPEPDALNSSSKAIRKAAKKYRKVLRTNSKGVKKISCSPGHGN